MHNAGNEMRRPGTSGQVMRQTVSSSQQVTGINGHQLQPTSNHGNIFKNNKDNIRKNQVIHQSNGALHILGSNSQVINQSKKDKNSFQQMNNNFMQGNQTGNVTVQGHKTAYGFVGGINGQALNTMTIGQQNIQQKKHISKGNLHNNIQNGIINTHSQNQQIQLNKRVFSANRATSLNNSNMGSNQTSQQFSMQQRRRQQAAYNQNAKHGEYKNMINKVQLNNGGQSNANFQNGQQYGSSNNIGHHAIVNLNRQNQPKQNNNPQNNNPNQKYSDDEGFMRGARIAEKIQEYYHTNTGVGGNQLNTGQGSKQSSTYQPNSESRNTGNQGSKQIGQPFPKNKDNAATFQMNPINRVQGNRQTHTSHDQTNANMRLSKNSPDNQNIHNQDNTGLKGRASSSYGSLKSRTNNPMVSSGSIVKPGGQIVQAQNNLNKSGVSATSGVMLNASNYASNTRYYHDQTGSIQRIFSGNQIDNLNSSNGGGNAEFQRSSTIGSQGGQMDSKGGMSNLFAQTGNIRPITRDVKLRSQARNNQSNSQVKPQIYATNGNTNQTQHTNISAVSIGSGTKTFTNTINIGSFINEINQQQNQANQQTQQFQIQNQVNAQFPQTIDSSVEGQGNIKNAIFNPQSKTNGSEQEEDNTELRNTTKLHSIANTYSQGSIENQNGTNGGQAKSFHGSVGTNLTNQMKGDNFVKGTSGVDSQNQEIMNIQDDNNIHSQINMNGERVVEGIAGIPNSDIRQIKLNYIQLNKRATTANTHGNNGRKIPQKNVSAVNPVNNQVQNEYNNMGNVTKKGTMDVKGQFNVYQDGINSGTGQILNPQELGRNQRKSAANIPYHDAVVVNPAQIQNQYRHLQTRQTRRIINAGAGVNVDQKQQVLGHRGINILQGNNDKDKKEAQKQTEQQQNYAQLAYQVEKYKDGNPNGSLDGGGESNQFCTDSSDIENIDNFIIGKRIGQGAYAVVRVGLHKILNQKIAVKIYEKFKLLEPNRRKSVKREIKIMEKIDHECLAKLFEAFESHKQVFLIMEYVNGGSLHGYLKGKPNRQMAEIEAKYLWQQVVFGIHYLHQRNVTHRDIKLENILLDETKTRVKLIDFGFSTCIPHEKKVKIFCGTPSYMAPEIVSKIEYAGPPADIWALGILLYALLCGRFPFKGANDKELYHNICKQELPLPDHISRQAKQLLLKIFHKNPDKRPQIKDILRDPWLVFSSRDQEMMSPKSLSFINYLKQVSGINFGYNQSGKSYMNKTMGNFGNNRIGGQNQVENVSATTFYIQSKDKRHQMHAPEVKQFIFDDNVRRTSNRKKNLIHHEAATSATYNSNEQKQKGPTDSTRFNLNDTMPLGGIGSNSINMIRQKSSDTGMRAVRNDDVVDTKLNDKINMEAYQAYYNTNENSVEPDNQNQGTLSQDQPNHYNPQPEGRNQINDEQRYPDGSGPQNMKIINNIMHINHSGANINIMCGNKEEGDNDKQQNNFIFNHTAPINLNFYEEVNKKLPGGLTLQKENELVKEQEEQEK